MNREQFNLAQSASPSDALRWLINTWTARLRVVVPCALCCIALLGPWKPVSAQQCYSAGFSIPFGTVSTSSNTDVIASLPYNCQSNDKNTYFQICLMIPGGSDSDISGLNPRLLKDYNNHYVAYNLYSDPAHTQIIGPAGSSYMRYSAAFTVPGGYVAPARTFAVYGRVPLLPAGTAAGSYQAQMNGLLLQYAWSNSSTPSDCFQSPGGSVVVGFSGVTATVSNACSIAIGQALPMDFGSQISLASPRLSTSTITLNCPANSSWRVGLDNGLHAAGGTRRMAASSTDFVAYELYRDPARSQRWGNDVASGTDTASGSGSSQVNPTVLTVYGTVPAQPEVAPGGYADTITITLMY